jgi:hypothetical protein
VPDTRSHRGPHPDDAVLFAAPRHDSLRAAVGDLSWLLSRGYSPDSALKIVGDRYGLDKRQRTAVTRSSCGQDSLHRRRQKEVTAAAVKGSIVNIDGFNLLTTIEAAIAGGLVLDCSDGAYRDLASMHGTWRRVGETYQALGYIGQIVDQLTPSACVYYLDRPVSNSGRLRKLILDASIRWRTPWRVEVVDDPDPVLAKINGIVVTSDSQILNSCEKWYNLASAAIEQFVPEAWIINLHLNDTTENQ